MCGRTACTLAPTDICRACGHRGSDGNWRQPGWRDPPGGQKYSGSYNAAPGSHQPVMISKRHMASDLKDGLMDESAEAELCEWVIQPMRWGLIPPWHSGDIKSAGYNMTNARSDGMLEKRTYKVPLEKGRRCVVLVEGYYEWQTKDGKKQPYFIYFPQTTSTNAAEVKKFEISLDVKPDVKPKLEDVKVDAGIKQEEDVKREEVWSVKTEVESKSDQEKTEQSVKFEDYSVKSEYDPECGTKRLMTLAGLFEVWKPKNGEPPVYSYSIITVDSHPSISWLHHRMPAILDGEKEVADWLDSGNVLINKAVELIRPTNQVQHHPVSSVVNSSRNNTPECVKPIDLKKPKVNKMMAAWLTKAKVETKPDAGGQVKVKTDGLNTSPSKGVTKRPNMMISWLSKAKPSPEKVKVESEPVENRTPDHEDHDENNEPQNKKPKH